MPEYSLKYLLTRIDIAEVLRKHDPNQQVIFLTAGGVIMGTISSDDPIGHTISEIVSKVEDLGPDATVQRDMIYLANVTVLLGGHAQIQMPYLWLDPEQILAVSYGSLRKS